MASNEQGGNLGGKQAGGGVQGGSPDQHARAGSRRHKNRKQVVHGAAKAAALSHQ
ncbi:hypothetical protein [Massilia sp. BKSP1R2A-1]|uniref:hypothetical protein n=1 Tax=Massilia sp. BKSP1R2A-1 TaxID=3422595 RepID=UPI003D357694